MTDAVIVDAVRTPLGRRNGKLAGWHPVDLAAHTLSALVERTGIDPAVIDDVIMGCVSQVGEQTMNISRNALLAAGFPDTVPGTTIDRQCGSSQQAAHFAAQGVLAGAYDVVIAAGIESMSRVPMGSTLLPGSDPFGTKLVARYPNLVPQGISAELIAAKWGLSREDQDRFALRSQDNAKAARDEGRFDHEIVPLKTADADGAVSEITTDEGIRESSLDGLARLQPAFAHDAYAARFPQISWSVTAGNSSQLTDGAAAVLLTTPEKASELGLRPRARLHTMAVEGDDPLFMLTAIIPATRKLLARSGLALSDIDLFEVNEAFASVVLAWMEEIGADPDKVNVNGGAIALGHPLGGSGARLATTLVNALEQRDGQFGLQVMCEAGGLSNAMIIERL
jgi:acetyl-CoA acyltransferase